MATGVIGAVIAALALPAFAVAQCPLDFAPRQNAGTGINPWSVAAADFNADSRSDLAVVNATNNNVSIFLGNGDGTFQPRVNYATGTAPGSVAVGDFNGDTTIDLAVANFGANSVSILLANGDGTFRSPAHYAAGTQPHVVAVGRFNSDAYPDLAVTAEGSNQVAVLLGNSDGSFQSRVGYAVGSAPQTVAIADLDADGDEDLAVTNVLSDTVSVLLGNGDGTFRGAFHHAANDGPRSVCAADFNADTSLDLVVVNSNQDTVSILFGRPPPNAGAFQPVVSFPVGDTPWSVAVADFTGDNLPDLAVGHFTINQLVVRAGNADGTFQTPMNFATGSSPRCIAVADLDGDARPDAAIASQLNNVVSIHLNRTTFPIMITNQPRRTACLAGGSAQFAVDVGGTKPLFQWRKDGVDLADGGGVSGVNTSVLTVGSVQLADSGAAFDCIVRNACGAVRTDPAGLGVMPECPADFNADSAVNSQDFFEFLTAFFAGC